MNETNPGFPACSHAQRKRARGLNKKTGLLLVCSEPFRVFFPLGVLVSIGGVSLWPLLYAGFLPFPPAIPHARIMIEGFFGGFIIGFLGTALPRMMSAPKLTAPEFGWFLFCYLGLTICHLAGKVTAGDAFFLILYVSFLKCMGVRLCFLRKDLPPPGFVLAGTGLLGAVAGVILLLTETLVPASPFLHRLATLLLYQGFVLLPILGVGGFLLPRFVGAPSGHDLPESVSPSRVWTLKALAAGLCALLLLGSFCLEAAGRIIEGRLLRFVVAIVYLLSQVPLFRRAPDRGTVLFGLRVGVLMICAGLLAVAAFPLYQKGLDHLLFVSGFGLVTLSVASRVILGHSGNIALAQSRSRPLQWVVWIVLLGALTRVSADPLPHIAVSHHIYAAICWVAAAVIWAVWLFPKLRMTE